MRRVFAALLVGTLGCQSARVAAPMVATAGVPPAAQITPTGAPIGLRQSMIADEWFWLRARVFNGEVPPALAAALRAMRDLQDALGGGASQWEDLEAPLGSASLASELVAAFGALPEKVDVQGHMVPLRALALRAAEEIEASEQAFALGPHREHDAALRRAARDLSTRLVPNEAAILRAIEADMGVPGVDPPIVVTLVADAWFRRRGAADDRGGRVAAFVCVRGLEGSALVEAVLAEALHAIDEINVQAPTTMNMLRGSLARRGLRASDSRVKMAVNAVTSAEAESLVRRFVDSRHRPNGEGGFYEALPAAPIAEAWERYVEGQDLQAMADAIAATIGAP